MNLLNLDDDIRTGAGDSVLFIIREETGNVFWTAGNNAAGDSQVWCTFRAHRACA